MPQIFVCSGCGDEVKCFYATTGYEITPLSIKCPKNFQIYRPKWRELVECE